MNDSNGIVFKVGGKLQSTQSIGDAGIVECIDISGSCCTLAYADSISSPFRINQENLNSSTWEVIT